MQTASASFADVLGRLESVGIVVQRRPDGSSATFRNGGALFEFSVDPPGATWADPALEAFLRAILAYHEDAQSLQQNRGRDTFMQRAALRDRLDVSPLLRSAAAARARVEEKKHLTAKELFFWHPSFGQFVRVSLLRGQSHVVDVTFASPADYLAVTYSLAVTDAMRSTQTADRAGRQGNLEAAAPAVERIDPTQAGDGIGPADIAGRTYSEVIASVRSGLTGDFKVDGALITSVAASCGGHPQAKEIRRELGRMLHAIAPDDVKAKFDGIVDGYESGFDQGLIEARAHIDARDVAAARIVLEDLIRRYGTGTGLYLDDSVSEYRHFANNFELALYAQLFRPTKQVRKLPQDRATLYSLYGAVLLELRDADGAEVALREALRVNPVSTDAMFELGEVMKISGRKREFRELTLRALEVAYTEAALGRAYRNLGYLAIEDANYDLAVACYCMSLGIDRDHAQAAQSELFYIQQVTGRSLALPDPPTVEARLATNGIQVGPSHLVVQLMDSAT